MSGSKAIAAARSAKLQRLAYFRRLGALGGRAGSVESKRAAALSRWGHVDTLTARAKAAGLPVNAVRMRLRHGWTLERALATPLRMRAGVAVNGEGAQ